MHKYTQTKYAGFWTRSVASFIDIILLFLPFLIVSQFFSIESILNIQSILLLLIISYCYTIRMHRSSWSATFGKKIVGIKLVDSEFQRLSIFQLSKRFLYVFLSYVLLLIPFILFLNMIILLHNLWEYLFFVLVALPLLLMGFSKRKQALHDILANTVSIDPYYRPTLAIKLIRGIGTVILTSTLLGLMLLLYSHTSQEHHNFSTSYKNNDLNDNRIIFYNSTLKKYSHQFIEAKGVYEIFEMDIKKALSLTCIDASLREYNMTNRITRLQNFENHARNIYANSKSSIQKFKHNENYLGQHFYEYHLHDAQRIIENIIHLDTQIPNEYTCDRLLSIEHLYQIFITKYISNREEDLVQGKASFHQAPQIGRFNQDFYKQQLHHGVKWLNLLYDNNLKKRK